MIADYNTLKDHSTFCDVRALFGSRYSNRQTLLYLRGFQIAIRVAWYIANYIGRHHKINIKQNISQTTITEPTRTQELWTYIISRRKTGMRHAQNY